MCLAINKQDPRAGFARIYINQHSNADDCLSNKEAPSKKEFIQSKK